MRGFSLVELSIVLVVLGLLTGGILTGQNLIRASELRSVSEDIERYTAAVISFKDQYGGIPGDFKRATMVWGAQAGAVGMGNTSACDALTYTNPPVYDEPTCNGNGDGRIGSGWREVWRAWEHLANAGLVEGAYSGVSGSSTDIAMGTAGENIPRSKIDSDVGFSIVWTGTLSGHPTLFDGIYGNAWRLGGGNGMDERSNLTAEEVWNIDTKMDDGLPAYGSARVHNNTSRPNCATTDVSATAVYDVDNQGGGCNMMFIMGL